MDNPTFEQKIEAYYLAKEAYYKGDPIFSDEEFDALETELVKDGFDPTVGHTKLDSDRKMNHRFRMLSLDKYQVLTEDITLEMAKEIFAKYGPGELSWKYDGMAIEARYDLGVLKAIITRGDGLEGEEVTEKLKHLFPKTIDKKIDADVRCEVVMRQSTFVAKYAGKYAHSRNLVAGISKDLDPNDARKYDLQIAVLEAVTPEGVLIPIEDLDKILLSKRKEGKFINSAEALKEVFDNFRFNRFIFPIGVDGCVYTTTGINKIKHNNKYPENAVSIKFKPPRLQSVVTKIKWNLKKSGNYIPQVFFKPILVDGRKIKQANGHNVESLIKHGIKPGAKVDIVLSNDIIPMIQKTTI